MTTTQIDYRRCEDGRRHVWEYKGKLAQAYICLDCDLRVSKAGLKGATDA